MNRDQVHEYSGPRAGYAGRVSSLRFYLVIIRRRWIPIALMILVGAALGVAYQLHKKTTYQAHAQVQVNRQSLTSLLTNTADPTASSASNFASVVQTQAAVARSPQVAQSVVKSVPQAHLTYRQFLTNSQATPSVNSDVIDMYVTDPHGGDVATKLVNTYAYTFVQFRIQLDTAALKSAATELSQHIASLQATGIKADQRVAGNLAARLQQLQEFEALQTSNVLVTTLAVNATKVAPSPIKNVALGVLVGIVLALILTGALEALDTRIRTAEELEERLGLPTLGVVPPPPRGLKGLVTLERPLAPEAEAFRVLRLNLDMTSPDLDVKTVMFTSALKGEGKSTTLANLAVSMARGGLRVVLVDLDLRQPTLHTMFGVPRSPGVTGVVRGRNSLGDALRPVDVGPFTHRGGADSDSSGGQLRLLTAGLSPPDPGEFVTARAIRRLMESLGSEADIVLVDTPPTLVSDPYGISGAVDGIVLLARLPTLTRGAVEHLQRTLSTFNAPVLGLVRTGKIVGAGADYYAGYGQAPSAEDLDAEEPGAQTSDPDNMGRTVSAGTAAAGGGEPSPRE